MNQKSLLPGDFLNSLTIFQHRNNLSKLLVYLILIVICFHWPFAREVYCTFMLLVTELMLFIC